MQLQHDTILHNFERLRYFLHFEDVFFAHLIGPTSCHFGPDYVHKWDLETDLTTSNLISTSHT